MRLGGMLYRPETVAELEALVPSFDVYGLSAICGPSRIAEMSDGEAAAFGERARELGLVIGEVYYRPNMMTADQGVRAQREAELRVVLHKAELMGCRSVLILVGSVDESDHHLAPHPYMETDACKAEFREQLLRVLDGLELERTGILIEPWPTTFFHRPEAIREFFDSLGHPKVGLHLDQMNMVSPDTYFHTTDLVNTTFELLGDAIGSAHLKDVLWDRSHMFMKFDEVLIGDGFLDYETLLRRLAELDRDVTCYCEHLPNEGLYAVNFARLHHLADKVGTSFIGRER